MFAEHGPDVVTVRAVAGAAGVSPALVLRHYGSRDGLRESVDHYVVTAFEAALSEAVAPPTGGPFDQQSMPAVADLVSSRFPAGSPIPAYLGRLLLAGGPGSMLFRKLHEISRSALVRMEQVGAVSPSADPPVRAAFLLINDLAVLMLRDRLRDVLGIDPLSPNGLRRWGAEVMTIYRDGLTARPVRADDGRADPDESR